ncbi:type I-E CRISPR-associated protein Cse2/CasB [Methylocaldum sp. RMAD-M]|jgi:CRISPR system Cascade subunit CasB|uniref:type I-E CRISPR-associated protein Cse2/CasB n=1 Tax=unclassified Methylocaldum TaxID=2622260 RepID=UPI000A3273C9|nr:type I-E CRISPR-associated protein Cse2/CasB [Methylocaldum sp. RMAD-M]MBP1148345.1 CRISPR system Cascade subunit CasB [Methylocaldum sp. RMAD-M]
MKNPFEPKQPASETLYRWWEQLENNKGERAALSRCATITEVLLCPAFYTIAQPLEEQVGLDPCGREGLAAIVGLLAHVRANDAQKLPQAMATGDAKPAVSAARFRRLLEAQTLDELYPLMRRVLGLLDKTANVRDLARSLYDWNDSIRKEWAYAYFAQAAKNASQS